MDKDLKADKIAQGIISFLKKDKDEELIGLVIKKLQEKSFYGKKAVVISPTPLSELQKVKSKEIVKKLTKDSSVFVEFKIDPEIIDGMQIVYEDKLWDLSVSGQISEIIDLLD